MKQNLPFFLLVACGIAAAVFAADGIGTSSLTTIDTTDHTASVAAPFLETRAGDALASAAGRIDTASPIGFLFIVR